MKITGWFSVILQTVSLKLSVSSPLSISLTCYWLNRPFLPSPPQKMLCCGWVILMDNILLKHRLKVNLRERGWLLLSSSLVATLVLHAESLEPSRAAGTISAPLHQLLAAPCEREGWRHRENQSSHSGWSAKMFNFPATPHAPSFSPGIPTSPSYGEFLWPCSLALTSIRLVKP